MGENPRCEVVKIEIAIASLDGVLPGKLLDDPGAHGLERLGREDLGAEDGQELAELDGRKRHRARQRGRRHGDGCRCYSTGWRSGVRFKFQLMEKKIKTLKEMLISPICFVSDRFFLLFYSFASADFQAFYLFSLGAINRVILPQF